MHETKRKKGSRKRITSRKKGVENRQALQSRDLKKTSELEEDFSKVRRRLQVAKNDDTQISVPRGEPERKLQ